MERARDQVNCMLQRFMTAELHDGQQAEVEVWRCQMARDAHRPSLLIHLAAWESGGGSNSGGSGGSGGDGTTPSSPSRPPRAKRMWVLPLGSTLSWCNDLTCTAELWIAGAAQRVAAGGQVDMYMHTLGWGRYKWRKAPAEADAEAEGEGEMHSSRSSRSSQHEGGEGGWFVAEVKVQPTDLVTQYGTFVEECEEEEEQEQLAEGETVQGPAEEVVEEDVEAAAEEEEEQEEEDEDEVHEAEAEAAEHTAVAELAEEEEEAESETTDGDDVYSSWAMQEHLEPLDARRLSEILAEEEAAEMAAAAAEAAAEAKAEAEAAAAAAAEAAAAEAAEAEAVADDGARRGL